MLFSSVTFLFIFLPFIVIGYYLLPKFLRNWFLLLGSILFYAWGEPKYLLVMFAIILVNYLGALLINKFDKYSKFWLFVTVISNVAFLIYFKYFNFLIDNLNLIFNSKIPILNIALPLGISFYTFQALSYSIDVYRKIVKPQTNFFKLALYISLFPQLIAGPIVKYHDIVDQIDNRRENLEQFYYGLRRFIIGLSKKVLIANILGAVADRVFQQLVEGGVGIGVAWIGGITRALQVYYDFSGYSDMAIGLGALFGFTFMENFNYPYISKTMSEYWRRWHISLGTWCRDYIYFPMGGSRVPTWRIYFNLFTLFFIIGLWHGASWNFVAFGILNAIFIMAERFFGLSKKEEFDKLRIIPQYFYMILMFIVNAILANTDTFKHSVLQLKTMFGLIQPNHITYALPYYVDRIDFIVICVAIICCAPVFKNMLRWENIAARVTVDIWLFVLLILSCSQIASSTYNPFIYFRF